MQRTFRLAVAAVLVSAVLPLAQPGQTAEGSYDPNHVLVSFRPGATREERARAQRAAGGRLVKVLRPLGVQVVRVPKGRSVTEVVARYRRQRAVRFAEPNYALRALAIPNDPGFPGNRPDLPVDQWALHNTGQAGGVPGADIRAPEGWDATGVASGSPWPTLGFTVGVIDTGADFTHPDLSGKAAYCRQATSGDGTLTDGCSDDQGHGTHVAGIIAATANNGVGVAGVAFGARIAMCKALNALGTGFAADVAACINDLVARRDALNLRVINMSVGGPQDASVLRAAADAALAAGVLIVAAAGNDGSSAPSFPAAYPSVVSVAATDRSDGHAPFSNTNADVEVAAPGVDILSTFPGGYVVQSGTSMSSPIAAAVAAWIAFQRGLSGPALRDALDAATDDLGPPGRDPLFGFGRVNLCKALGGTGCGVAGPPAASPPPSATGVLEGTAVRARSGRPRRGVTVQASGPASSAVRTGRDGRYRLDLPPGTYEVTAFRRRRQCLSDGGQATVTVEVTAGAVRTVNWRC